MTTAFVLSGGASLGAVQVGMLQALVARGITPDVICGTSVGALNGAWLASGATVENINALADLWRGLHRRDAFPFSPVTGLQALIGRSDHLVSNRGLRRIVKQNIDLRAAGGCADSAACGRHRRAQRPRRSDGTRPRR